MQANQRGPGAIPRTRRTAVALALLVGSALSPHAAQAGEHDTVGADDRCFEGRDDFRDLDGNGCPEPLVAAGDVRLRFLATGSGRTLQVTVASLSLTADKAARVAAGCVPACGGRVRRAGSRVEVEIPRTFGYGDLIGVRVWRDGFVGRFYGYRIKKRRPKYMACVLRSPDGSPRRCHS